MSVNGKGTMHRAVTKQASSGAVDEEIFKHVFSTVSSLPIYSPRDLSEYMGKIKDCLNANPEDWERRVNGLKDLRNVVNSGGQQIDEFQSLLRTLEAPVLSCIQDLRSQVVREACITVAYLSQELGNKFDHFAEVIMQPLLNLIPNSAKVMSTSGSTAIDLIIRHTFSSRLFPIIAGAMSSKSNAVRKHVCIFMDPILQFWPVHVLERHMALIQEVLRKGVNDADQDARSATRRAFVPFSEKFPDQVEVVLRCLDPSKRKAIERTIAASGAIDDQSSVASGTSSRAASQTNLASSAVKRTGRPAMGTTAAAAAARRPTVPEFSKKNLMSYGDVRSRYGTMGVGGGSKTSMSQPASRETSPLRTTGSEVDFSMGAAARAYAMTLANNQNSSTSASTMGRRRFGGAGGATSAMSARGVRRSSRASRDASPTSSAVDPYLPVGTGKRPSLSSMSDAGYKGYARSQYESDDNASETSSMCSERSGQSMPVYRRNHMRPLNRFSMPRTIKGFDDTLKMLRSTQWSEKKEGLMNLKEYLRSGQPLSPQEVVQVSEVLSNIFGESSSKVITPFMETLQLFIRGYNQYLHDWIYKAMVRLFNRQGQEVLSTHQKSIADTLAVIRSSFPLTLQFACCCRFIIDDAVSPNLKVKARVLEYLKDLLVMMPADTITNPTLEMVKGITRVIAWSTEPKSADVRRLASRVVIKLSELNPLAFAAVVQQMPKTSQDQSAKLLKTYAKTTNIGAAAAAGYDATSPDGPRSNRLGSKFQRSYSLRQPTAPKWSTYKPPTAGNGSRPFSPISATYVPSVRAGVQPPNTTSGGVGGRNRSVSIPDGRFGMGGSVVTPPPPPPYSANTGEGNGGNGTAVAAAAGHHYFSMASPGADDGSRDAQSAAQNQQFANKSPQQAPPSLISGFTNDMAYPKIKKPVIGYQTLKKIREMPPEDAIAEILQELSNYNDRYEQRKACMLKLIKLLRDGTIQTWEEHSKPTLLILLESLSDTSSETRALALRVLQELVRTQSELISDYACLTVMKILEACNDTDKGVIRSAEECAQTVARHLSQELCLRLLTTVINDSNTSLNLAAVKMQTQVVKAATPDLVQEVLPDLIPGLVLACNHEDSHMRKASIFCLVQIALKFGDAVWDYLNELTASKKRLLRIYIEKELENSGRSSESVRVSGNLPVV